MALPSRRRSGLRTLVDGLSFSQPGIGRSCIVGGATGIPARSRVKFVARRPAAPNDGDQRSRVVVRRPMVGKHRYHRSSHMTFGGRRRTGIADGGIHPDSGLPRLARHKEERILPCRSAGRPAAQGDWCCVSRRPEFPTPSRFGRSLAAAHWACRSSPRSPVGATTRSGQGVGDACAGQDCEPRLPFTRVDGPCLLWALRGRIQPLQRDLVRGDMSPGKGRAAQRGVQGLDRGGGAVQPRTSTGNAWNGRASGQARCLP